MRQLIVYICLIQFRGVGLAQAAPLSPVEIVRYLTYESDRPGLSLLMMGLGGCHKDAFDQDRSAAIALAESAGEALPAIDRILHAVESIDGKSPLYFGSEWLILAYAKIRGPLAIPRLQKMLWHPTLAPLRKSIEAAIALVLPSTSFVASMTVPGRVFRCQGVSGPRESLDQLIIAWQSNDIQALTAAIEPGTIGDTRRLLPGKTWSAARMRGKTSNGIAFRFETSAPWARPPETLERGVTLQDQRAEEATISVETSFRTLSGGECGRLPLSFSRKPDGEYLISGNTLPDLVRVLLQCSTEDSHKPK